MKFAKFNKKFIYFFTIIFFTFVLAGCKEKGSVDTAFDGLPESHFLAEVKASLKDKKPVAVAFTAEWCPHCRQYKPIFFEVKDIFKDQVTFLNIDVDDKDGSPISGRFQVNGIPTSAFIRADGSVYKIEVGEVDKERLKGIINELLASKKKNQGDPVAPFPIKIEKKESEKVEKKEEPKVEEPQKEEPKIEEPKKEEPKIEEKVEERKVEPKVAQPEEKDLPPQELIKEEDSQDSSESLEGSPADAEETPSEE